jgi:hypothetical protein
MSSLLLTFLAMFLAVLLVSVIDARFRHPTQVFSSAGIEPAPRMLLLRVAAVVVIAGWAALLIFVLAIILASTHLWQSEMLAYVSLAMVVGAGLFYLPAALAIRCSKCGRPLIFQWVTSPKFSEPYRGLNAWASIVVRVALRKSFRCMYCGQSYAS